RGALAGAAGAGSGERGIPDAGKPVSGGGDAGAHSARIRQPRSADVERGIADSGNTLRGRRGGVLRERVPLACQTARQGHQAQAVYRRRLMSTCMNFYSGAGVHAWMLWIEQDGEKSLAKSMSSPISRQMPERDSVAMVRPERVASQAPLRVTR